MADRRHDDRFLLGFVFGVAASALVGGLGAILWAWRKSQQAANAVEPVSSPNQVSGWGYPGLGYAFPIPMPPPMQVPPILPALPAIDREAAPMVSTVVHRPSSMRSFTLREVQTVRIATAQDDGMTLVTVRVVQPPGQFVSVAIDPGSLFQDTGISVGDTSIIPVGDQQTFRLSPKQPLYARASQDGVIISVTQTDLDDRDPSFSAVG